MMHVVTQFNRRSVLMAPVAFMWFVGGCSQFEPLPVNSGDSLRSVEYATVEGDAPVRRASQPDESSANSIEYSGLSAPNSRPSGHREEGVIDYHWTGASYLLDGTVESVGAWRSNTSTGDFPWVTPAPDLARSSYITVTIAVSDVVHPVRGGEVYTDVHLLDRYVAVGTYEWLGSEERAFIEEFEVGDRVFAFLLEFPSELYAPHPPETEYESDYFSPMMEAVRAHVQLLETQQYSVGYGLYHEFFRIEGDEMHSAYSGLSNGDAVLSTSAFREMFGDFHFP